MKWLVLLYFAIIMGCAIQEIRSDSPLPQITIVWYWDSSYSYSIGEVCRSERGTGIWRSLQDENLNHVPDETAGVWWRKK